MTSMRSIPFWLLSLGILLHTGCGSTPSSRLQRHDPSTVAAKAMEAYDANGDGKLAKDELKAVPSLAASGRRVDLNHDGEITTEEIQTRMEQIDPMSDFVGLDVRILSKGQPLEGAHVTFVPEPFMGDGYQTFSGTTVAGGGCPLVGDGRQLPGIPVGFYTAKIVHSAQGIDAARGIEIADDATGNRLEIAL